MEKNNREASRKRMYESQGIDVRDKTTVVGEFGIGKIIDVHSCWYFSSREPVAGREWKKMD